MRRGGVILAGLTLFNAVTFSQPTTETPAQSLFLYYEAVNLVADDPRQSRIDIHYRIDQEFFVPVRNTDRGFPHEFKRRGEVAIELFDSTGIAKARDIARFEIGATTDEGTFESKQWYQRMVSFDVQPGLYTISLEVDDLESERIYRDRTRTARAKRFDLPILQLSTPIFSSWLPGEFPPEKFWPQNFGGNILYGTTGGLFIQSTSDHAMDAPVRVEYLVSTERRRFEDPTTILSDTIESAATVAGLTLEISAREDSLRYSVGRSPSSKATGVFIPIPFEKLPLRNFELNLTILQGTRSEVVKKQFKTVWPDMPLSLRDVDFALNALRYITTEKQLDSLRRGTWDDRLSKLEGFWKEKDKTPETDYNEVMTEYYRRVDFAMRSFGTIREPDGSKSDRGRIFIIYGQPTQTQRNLDPTTGFQEIWIYENLGKKFTFVDKTKSGNYVLVATTDL